MNQQQAWYAAMFINTCGGADHALAKYIEGGVWAVELEGSPGTVLWTIVSVLHYMIECHGGEAPPLKRQQ